MKSLLASTPPAGSPGAEKGMVALSAVRYLPAYMPANSWSFTNLSRRTGPAGGAQLRRDRPVRHAQHAGSAVQASFLIDDFK